MPAVTRRLSAFAALGLAMLLSAGCAAPKRTEVALTGSDSAADDLAVSTTSPPASTAAADPTTVATTIEQPTTEAGPTVSEAASLSAPAPAAPSTTSTTSVRAAAKSTTTTTDPDVRQLDEVEAALGRQDICGVYAGLAEFDLATASTDRLIAQLTRIHDIMQRASKFASPTLATDWDALTVGVGDLRASLERDRALGKGSEPSHYDDDDYSDASQRVGAWMDRNCA